MAIDKSVSPDGRYNINCAGSNTGTIDISPVNNAGSVTYLWNDGIWGFSRVNLKSGEYSVILTDANNCTADSTITLTQPDSLKLRFDVINPFCPDQADGTINLIVTGGVPGPDYNYLWSNKSTDKNLSNISEGFYTVKVTDQNGCAANDSIQVKSTYETCLIIPNAISPNGDLINDVFNIGNSEYYPLMEVTIINNWGQTVWKSEKGYPVPWDGRSNGVKLPIDSYFYIINLHNGSKLIAGSITIIK
jgi:gliding motility-associated-like protein